jgi:hypothetical protein
MITKFLYTAALSLFVWSFASTTQLPRLIYTNFIAPAASQQPATGEPTNQQQKIKKPATGAANGQKSNIMPSVSVSTPKPSSQTPAQLGFLFAVSLLNLFIGYKLVRWIYRVFLRTPLYLIAAAARFLVVKPYKFLTTPQITARYEFMHSVPNSSVERTIIVQ